jgi:hypothetical protein
VNRAVITLRDRRDAEIITNTEQERLSEVSDRIEELAADRAEALIELANLPENGESPRTLAGGCILVPILIGLERSALSVVWVIYVGCHFCRANFPG